MDLNLRNDLDKLEGYYLELDSMSKPEGTPGYDNFLSSYKELQEIINDDSEYGRKVHVRVQEKLGHDIYEYKNALEWAMRFWTVIVPFSGCIYHITKHSSSFASCSNTCNTLGELYVQGFELLLEGKGVDKLKEALERKCFEIIEKDDEITDIECLRGKIDKVYSYLKDYAAFVNFDGDITLVKERITSIIRFAAYVFYGECYVICTEREREIIERIFHDELTHDLVTEVRGKVEMGEANILSDKYRYSYPTVDIYLSQNGIDIEEMLNDCRTENYSTYSLAYYILNKAKKHQEDFHLNTTSLKPPSGFIRELMLLMDRFVKKDYYSENNLSKKFTACMKEMGLK